MHQCYIVDLVEKLDGVEAAQRFVLSGAHRNVAAPYKYLALYWNPENKLATAQAMMKWQGEERVGAIAAGREPVINRLEVFEAPRTAWFYSKISERYTNPETDVIVVD